MFFKRYESIIGSTFKSIELVAFRVKVFSTRISVRIAYKI